MLTVAKVTSGSVGVMVVLTGVDGIGPPTGDRPRRETAAGWRRAKSGESATARSALDKGKNTVLPAHSGLRPLFTTEERIRSGSSVMVGPGFADIERVVT